MSDVRREFSGADDPWQNFEPEDVFVTDHMYGGGHETIEDLLVLYDTTVAFEVWVHDFRCEDVLHGRHAASLWEHNSAFSETKSIQLSRS